MSKTQIVPFRDDLKHKENEILKKSFVRVEKGEFMMFCYYIEMQRVFEICEIILVNRNTYLILFQPFFTSALIQIIMRKIIEFFINC